MTEAHGISRKKAIAAEARRWGELLYTLMKHGTEYEPRRFGVNKAAGAALASAALRA